MRKTTATIILGRILSIGLLVISTLTFSSALDEVRHSEEICPFQCTCVNSTLQCHDLTLFPPGIPPTTQSIIISNSSFPEILMTDLKNLEHLRRFLMEFSSVGTIETCVFTGENLSSIVFKDTSIDRIASHSFADLRNMGTIMFVRCSVSSIDTNAFIAITEARLIAFRYSNITLVNSFAFQVLSNISFFDIKFCHIKYFSVAAFSKIEYVQRFRLTKNSFEIWSCPLETDSFVNVKAVIIKENQFFCQCNMTSLTSGDPYLLTERNRCHSSRQETGKFLNQTGWMGKCNSGCQKRSHTPPSFSCRYIFDDPIMPLEPIEYPGSKLTTASSNGDRAHEYHWTRVLIGLLWLILFQTIVPL
ncbi:hypothetical protein ScPMuIL_016718 [Solemya velum]